MLLLVGGVKVEQRRHHLGQVDPTGGLGHVAGIAVRAPERVTTRRRGGAATLGRRVEAETGAADENILSVPEVASGTSRTCRSWY